MYVKLATQFVLGSILCSVSQKFGVAKPAEISTEVNSEVDNGARYCCGYDENGRCTYYCYDWDGRRKRSVSEDYDYDFEVNSEIAEKPSEVRNKRASMPSEVELKPEVDTAVSGVC